MDGETTEAVRHAGNLQSIVNEHRILLESRPTNEDAIYRDLVEILSKEFDQDFAKVIHYIQVKLDWPLSLKRLLLQHVRQDASNNHDRFNNLASFVFDPAANIKRTHRFRKFTPTIASIERQYGSGVCSIFHLQYGFFLINILTLIIWLALIILPYRILAPSNSFSNKSFSFSSIFTSKDYLSESILFQGSYTNARINKTYNLSLVYFLTGYIYFLVWFIFITIHFSSAYKQKVFNSILNTKLDIGFMCTFGRCNYTIRSPKENEKHIKIFQRQFLDLIGNDERIKQNHSYKYQTCGYKFKTIITNLFYILLAIVLGGVNWMILSFCDQKLPIDCYGSIIFLALINRLMPYVIVILAQVERYKYLSYKLDAVGFRCMIVNICTILSFTIQFFINAPPCYETAYGQYIYILLLADLFASLILPVSFGLFFDLISEGKNRDFDGINVHVQISPPVLLYSQFLIWIGTYFSPLISLMMLINIFFSYLSHRFYLYIRSRRSDSYKRVFIWNAYRLEYLIYLLAYIILVISITALTVFTTQIKPSENCGPFRHLNASYEVISNALDEQHTSVLWLSIINFLTSPGLIYFLGVTFFIVAYKLRHEGLAEKQLVFIRENNLDRKKHIRQNAVKKLHRQEKTNPLTSPSTDDRQDIRSEDF